MHGPPSPLRLLPHSFLCCQSVQSVNYSSTDFLGMSLLAKHSAQARGVSFSRTNSASAFILQPGLGGDQKPQVMSFAT